MTAMTIHRAVTILADSEQSSNVTRRQSRQFWYWAADNFGEFTVKRLAFGWQPEGFGMRTVSRTVPATEKTI